jgi:hypothetical protein
MIARYDVAVCMKIVENSRIVKKVKQRAAVRDFVEQKYNEAMTINRLER